MREARFALRDARVQRVVLPLQPQRILLRLVAQLLVPRHLGFEVHRREGELLLFAQVPGGVARVGVERVE